LQVIRPEEEDASAILVAKDVSDTCDFAWSPDGTQLALATATEPGVIMVFRLGDRKLSRLHIDADKTISEIVWSLDGNSILATVRGDADDYYQLWEFEIQTGRSQLRVKSAGDISNPISLADGTHFLYSVLLNGITTVSLGNREHGWVRNIGPVGGVVRLSHVAPDAHSVYARYSGLTLPPSLIEIPLDGTAATTVYAPPRSEESQCPAPEFLWLDAPDGVRVPAYHWAAHDLLPGAPTDLHAKGDVVANARSGESAKTVLIVVHGGLHSQTFPTWEPWLKVFVEHGCDVVAINFRGSSGYGHSFERLGVETERVQDIQAARNYAVNTLKVPPTKVFLMGNSHGAGLVAAAAGQGQELGGLLLVSWAGAVKGVKPRFAKPFPVIEFHGSLDAVLSPKAAQASLENFLSLAEGHRPKPQWRVFQDDGHFFYYANSWTRLYWETMRLMDTN
jgi:dipeptidyl aminopeptidase/acylaminoacyl peptidase